MPHKNIPSGPYYVATRETDGEINRGDGPMFDTLRDAIMARDETLAFASTAEAWVESHDGDEIEDTREDGHQVSL